MSVDVFAEALEIERRNGLEGSLGNVSRSEATSGKRLDFVHCRLLDPSALSTPTLAPAHDDQG